MKFRIKVKKYNDGTFEYSPQAKEGLLSRWTNIVPDDYNGLELSNGVSVWHKTIIEAQDVITNYKEQIGNARKVALTFFIKTE